MSGLPLAPQNLEGLLEASWPSRGRRRLDRREARLEAVFTLAFLLAATALLALAPGPQALAPTALAVTLIYAVASRTDFPLATGSAVPTQLFLVVLFATASPALVPLLVFAALIVGALCCAMRGRTRADRVLFAGGDAVHALGPALVLVAAGQPDLREAAWPVLLGAFAAQLALDFLASTLREWAAHGVRPHVQLRALYVVWAIDAALAPLGLLVVHAAPTLSWAPFALVPLCALLVYAARERSRRIARAHERLEALQRERHRLHLAVRRIGDAFASSLDLGALLLIVARAAVEALDAQEGSARTADGTGQRTVAPSGALPAPGLGPLLACAQGRALGATSAVEVAENGSSALACRIEVDAEPVGVIAVARHGAAFEEEDRGLLAYLCEQAGVSAANVVHHETLHRQALTDGLTGLANQRRLQELLDAAAERHAHVGASAALILLDLDDFKRINDRHGHQTGDEVLRAVGRCLRQECRLGDEPARYGGEELAVLVRDADLEPTHALALRIRRALSELGVPGPNGDLVRVTASFGIAALGGPVRTSAELVATADAALYEAKRAGKDCVRAVQPLPRGDASGRFTPAALRT